eukprot:Em0022g925a
MCGLLLFVVLLFGSCWCSTQGLRHHRTTAWNHGSPPRNPSGYSYDTRYYTQWLDHFNVADGRTFQQRYLISLDYWNPSGPMFFYTGNEGDITWFCNNTGFMWDIAPQFNAMLVFAEHRYYGDSLPFGPDSYKDADHLAFLMSEQALADFAELVTGLKGIYGDMSVFAFGGSYGGMLAAWFRMLYPSVVVGSLASSAPIWMFPGLAKCEGAYQVITNDFKKANVNCSTNIQNSWSTINQIASKAGGLDVISKTFTLCQALNNTSDVNDFVGFLVDTWFNLAMVDYPYPASFLEPLPAWPIEKTCLSLSNLISDPYELLTAVAESLQVYYNYTGTTSCFNVSQTAVSSLGAAGWDFQTCTEMVMPTCSNGVSDMFPSSPWNLTAFEATCMQMFGLVPRPYWTTVLYGGIDIHFHSNIIFSNGDLDPWSAGGVTYNISDTLVALIIPDGAHHLDLRAATALDPPDVVAVRATEVKLIGHWIQEADQMRKDGVSKRIST